MNASPQRSGRRTLDVLAVGGAAVDLALTLDHLPGYDEKVLGDFVGYLPGGPAANFACAGSRLGLRVASLSNVGDDERGRMVIDEFTRFGVDTSLVQALDGTRTNFTVIMTDPTGEKAIVYVPMFRDVFRLDLAESVLPRTRYLYMMPSDHEQFLALARLAHANGAEVMVDVEATVVGNRDALSRVLSEVDIASFNRNGFITATGEEPSVEAARRVLSLGPRTVVVTLGAEGALAVTRDESAGWPGHRVPVVDSTGAGDTFNAAYVWATVRGMPLLDRVRFANAAAALAVTGAGPRGRLPTQAEVEAFLCERDEGQRLALRARAEAERALQGHGGPPRGRADPRRIQS